MSNLVLHRRRLLYAGVTLAALAVLTHWFFHAGVLMKGDTVFHLNRILGIASGLAAGDFPVYVHGFQMLGYGTLDGALYPDLLLYLPAALVACGVPLALAYHAYWIFVTCLGFFAAWRGYTLLSGRAFLGLLAACLYVSSFYTLMFAGSGAGGYVAVVFLPYAVGALAAVLRRPDGARHWPELTAAFFVIACSHTISTLLTCVVLTACLVLWRRGLAVAKRRRALAAAALFSLALLLYRIVPFVYFSERVDFHIRHPMVTTSLATVTSDVFNLAAAQLWWGWPLVVLFCGALLSRAFRRRRAFWGALALAVLLTAGVWSYFPWQLIERLPVVGKVLPLFQFSFRFLLLGLVPLAYYAARYLAAALRGAAPLARHREAARSLALLLALAAVAFGMYAIARSCFLLGGQTITWQRTYEAIDPQSLRAFDDTVNPDYTYADFYPGEVFASGAVPAPGEVRSIAGDLSVASFQKVGTRLSLAYDSPAGAEVMVPLVFYPGYEARLDGAPLAVQEGAHHVITLALPAGEHTVFVRFRGPASFRVSAWLSLLSLVVLCAISLRLWLEERSR